MSHLSLGITSVRYCRKDNRGEIILDNKREHWTHFLDESFLRLLLLDEQKTNQQSSDEFANLLVPTPKRRETIKCQMAMITRTVCLVFDAAVVRHFGFCKVNQKWQVICKNRMKRRGYTYIQCLFRWVLLSFYICVGALNIFIVGQHVYALISVGNVDFDPTSSIYISHSNVSLLSNLFISKRNKTKLDSLNKSIFFLCVYFCLLLEQQDFPSLGAITSSGFSIFNLPFFFCAMSPQQIVKVAWGNFFKISRRKVKPRNDAIRWYKYLASVKRK